MKKQFTSNSAILSLKTNREHLQIWDINNVFQILLSQYYKKIISFEIMDFLNDGGDPSCLVIFSNDYEPEYASQKIESILSNKTLFNSDNILTFYEFGVPWSMLPRSEIEIIRIFFEQFKTLKKYIYLLTTKSIEDNKLKKAYSKLKDNNFSESISYLENIGEVIIERNIKSKNKKKEALQWIESWSNETIDSLEQSINNAESTEETNKLLMRNVYKSKHEIGNSSYIKKCNKFYEIYCNRLLPLIGSYNPVEKKIKFFGSDIITQNYNYKSLDLLSYSHNSPAEILLSGDAIGLFGLIISIYSLISQRKNKIKVKFEDFERYIDYTDVGDNDNIKETLKDIYMSLCELYDTGSFNSLKIESDLLTENIIDMLIKSDDIFESQLNEMGFRINEKKGFKIIRPIGIR